MIVGFGLVRYAIPSDYSESVAWLNEPERRAAIRLALDLVPFAGIAFMWFMGVVRNRLGALEDQFFATVFLGSGLLFVASLFCAAALMLGLIEPMAAKPTGTETFYFGRGVSDALFNIFAIKMAGVFIISTCTIGMRTHCHPPALDRDDRLHLRPAVVIGCRELEMDHFRISPLDAAGKLSHIVDRVSL